MKIFQVTVSPHAENPLRELCLAINDIKGSVVKILCEPVRPIREGRAIVNYELLNVIVFVEEGTATQKIRMDIWEEYSFPESTRVDSKEGNYAPLACASYHTPTRRGLVIAQFVRHYL